MGVLYCHVPNGGHRHPVTGAKMKRLGTKAGVPDILIFDKPKHKPDCCGIAIEMKRETGGHLRVSQKEWLNALDERGWYCSVCHGATEAIQLCKELGCTRRR